MKMLFCLSLFVSFNAFAIDFNKVTVSFDAGSEKKSDQVVTAMTNNFEKNTHKYEGRLPASASSFSEKPGTIQETSKNFR
jgi:exopolysaccharide biosynthesis protein